MTSTLQQEGGRKLRLSASQVMRVAQGLYERGFITYMRTDNVALSDEALQAVRAAVASEYGQQFLSPAAEAVHVEGEERPGGPRGDPPDHAAPLARAGAAASSTARSSRCTGWSGSARWPRRWPTRPAPPSACASARRATADRRRPTASSPRRARRSRSPATAQVYVESADERRRRRRAEPRRCCRRSPPATPCRSSRSTPQRPHHHAAGALHRGVARQAARGARHRPPVDVGVDHPDRSRTAATCGRRARRSCRPGPRSPSSACSSSTSTTSSTTTSRRAIEEDLDAIAGGERQKDEWLTRSTSATTGDDAAAA